MARPPSTKTRGRGTLSRDKVLHTAVRVADEGGIASLTMRRLAQELGVEPMSLYHHVKDKEAILDGAIEVVLGEINEQVREIEQAADGSDWKAVLRRRILTARDVFLAHRWAPRVMETRKDMSPEVMRYLDDLAGVMRRGGFSVSLLHHTLHTLGSRAFGFDQELFSSDDADADPDLAAIMMGKLVEQYPYITEVVAIESGNHDPDSTIGWCDDQKEFEFALDLLLDGLERLRDAELAGTPQTNGHA